jgi:hypothetical protein
LFKNTFAIGRFAEFGFLGVVTLALATVPRACGLETNAGVHLCFFFFKVFHL